MRISDWSSYVCSSDLTKIFGCCAAASRTRQLHLPQRPAFLKSAPAFFLIYRRCSVFSEWTFRRHLVMFQLTQFAYANCARALIAGPPRVESFRGGSHIVIGPCIRQQWDVEVWW